MELGRVIKDLFADSSQKARDGSSVRDSSSTSNSHPYYTRTLVVTYTSASTDQDKWGI